VRRGYGLAIAVPSPPGQDCTCRRARAPGPNRLSGAWLDSPLQGLCNGVLNVPIGRLWDMQSSMACSAQVHWHRGPGSAPNQMLPPDQLGLLGSRSTLVKFHANPSWGAWGWGPLDAARQGGQAAPGPQKPPTAWPSPLLGILSQSPREGRTQAASPSHGVPPHLPPTPPLGTKGSPHPSGSCTHGTASPSCPGTKRVVPKP
jgi:hypothetical protein